MKTWIEIGGTPLPHTIESHLETYDTVVVVVKDLTREEADRIEACLARDMDMAICTDYEYGYPAIVERILNAAVAKRQMCGDQYTLLIRDVTIRPPVARHYMREGAWHHGSGIGRD
jgi:hypothetical protein